MATKGSLIVISAPSGSGKTTLRRHLLERLDGVEFSVSYTTRPRRPDETDGVDYHFVTPAQFEEKVRRGELLEWAEVHGNWYGTGKAEVEAARLRGVDVLLDVDVQGAEQVRRAEPDAVTVFVLPPSFAELEARLRNRRQDDPEAIARRLAAARHEVHRYRDYDYVIVNESLDRSVRQLECILMAERARPGRMEEKIREVIATFEEGSS